MLRIYNRKMTVSYYNKNQIKYTKDLSSTPETIKLIEKTNTEQGNFGFSSRSLSKKKKKKR
jgi:hypothetical protein